MNEGNDTLNSSERPGSEMKSDQPLSRSGKIISAGLIASAAILWGVYGPGLMKDSWVEKWMDTSLGVAVLFIVCTTWSCIFLAARTRREEKNEPPRWRTSRLWAAAPWLITLPLLLTMNFQWQALMPGIWVGIALLLFCWPYLAKTGAETHSIKHDQLGRGLMYSRFGDKIRILAEDGQARDKGLSIAVTGEWGTGKSHFINAIVSNLAQKYKEHHKLHRERLPKYAYRGSFVTASVDLWQSSTVEAMWEDVARTLVSMLNERNLAYDNIFKKSLIGLLEFLPFRFTSLAEDTMRYISTGGFLTANSNQLVNRIEHSSKRYILVMDNIDRCSEEKLRAAFSLIEKLGKVRHLVLLCGIAKEEITAIGVAKSRETKSALLKVFDIEMPMPLLMQRQAHEYLDKLLKDIEIECPNFKRWCRSQDFSGTTPRLIERMVSQLSLIDNLYLLRHSEDIIYMDKRLDIRDLFGYIFCFEALRMVYPECPFPSINKKMDAKPDVMQEETEHWREHMENIFLGKKERGVINGEMRVFRNMLNHLCEATREYMVFIANQEYLRISALTDKECKKVLDEYVAGLTPYNALEKTYGGSYASRDVPSLLKCMCRYCVFYPEHHAALPFMEALCKLGTVEEFLPPYTITNIIRLMSSPVAVAEKRWETCMETIVQKCSMSALTDEVKALMKYIYNPKERFSISCEMARHLSPLAQELLRDLPEVSDSSDVWCDILKRMLKEISKAACVYILTCDDDFDLDGWYPLAFGQSIEPKNYAPQLRAGVRDFLASDASLQYRREHEIAYNKLLQTLIVLAPDNDTLEKTEQPFAVLSFAVIWSKLCHGLLGQRKLSKEGLAIVEKRLATIHAWEARDSAMSKEEKDAKAYEQVSRNRETAMRILRTTLERLQKGAGND